MTYSQAMCPWLGLRVTVTKDSSYTMWHGMEMHLEEVTGFDLLSLSPSLEPYPFDTNQTQVLLDDRGKNSRCGASLDVPSVPFDSNHFAYLKDRILRLILLQASDLQSLQSCVWNDLILFRDVDSKACAFLVCIEVPRIWYLD